MTQLTLKQKILLFLNGRCFLRYEKRKGWSGYLPIYLAKCDIHGFFENHPHGWTESLQCPACMEMEMNKK
jgi:hypothetical protein